MKILVVTTSYPLKNDGSEAAGSFVKDFVRTLGAEHTTAVLYPTTQSSEVFLRAGITHYAFQVPELPLSLLSPLNLAHWTSIYRTINGGLRMMDQAAEAFNPDHIIALWALPSGYWARKAEKKYGIPYSIWALGSDIWGLGKVPVVRNLLRKVLRGASFRFADGYQLLEDMNSISGSKGEFLPSTRILPVGTIVKKREQPPYRLTFLGRWHKNKGIDLLLDALALLNESEWAGIDEVVIAGGGPLAEDVESSVSDLINLGRPITLLGFLDIHQATELLLRTDYLLIPSRIESIPVVFSDALQTGTPMVVMPVGDFPKLFQREAPGEISSDVNAEAFASAIHRAIAHSPGEYKNAIKDKSTIFDMKKVVSGLSTKLQEYDAAI